MYLVGAPKSNGFVIKMVEYSFSEVRFLRNLMYYYADIRKVLRKGVDVPSQHFQILWYVRKYCLPIEFDSGLRSIHFSPFMDIKKAKDSTQKATNASTNYPHVY